MPLSPASTPNSKPVKPRPWLLGALLFSATISLLCLGYLWGTGFWRQLVAHSPPCEVLAEVPGGEDIVISRDGYAFISSLDRRSPVSDHSRRPGAILGLQLPKTSSLPGLLAPEDLSHPLDLELYPRGIALYEGAQESRLFVINYRREAFSVELFAWQDAKLSHLRTLTSPLFNQPGHIIATGPEQFYLSNERGLYTPTGHFIEDTLRLKRATIVYYDGREFHTAAKGLAFPGGLFLAGGLLYAAERNAQKVSAWQPSKDGRTLTLLGDLALGSFATHIKGDSTGHLWVTAHPQLLQYESYSLNPRESTAPTQVLRLDPCSPDQELCYHVQEFMLTLTGPLAGATVAAPYQNRLLLGAAFDDKLLMCQLSPKTLAPQ